MADQKQDRETNIGQTEGGMQADMAESQAKSLLSRRKLLAAIGMAGATLMCGGSLGGAGQETVGNVTYGNPDSSNAVPNTGDAGLTGAAAEAEHPNKQVDYVKLLKDHNETPTTIYAKVTGNRQLEVLIPFRGKRCAHYAFRKDPSDDFIKLENGAVSILQPVQTGGFNPVKQFEVLHSWSVKEFALFMTPTGSGLNSQWLPEHNNVGTTYAVRQEVFLDDTVIASWTPDSAVREVKSVKIVQQLLGKHPSDPSNPVADIYCVHSVNANGVSVKAKIKWLRPVTIALGYGMMFPVVQSFANKMITSFGNMYDATVTDGSTTNLIENDQAVSYAFLNTNGGTNYESDTVAAMTIQNICRTFRHGEAGRRSQGSIVWLQHRTTEMQKLYPQVFENYAAQAGDTYEIGGTFYIGELPMAAGILG